jgi:hypothetical protein
VLETSGVLETVDSARENAGENARIAQRNATRNNKKRNAKKHVIYSAFDSSEQKLAPN